MANFTTDTDVLTKGPSGITIRRAIGTAEKIYRGSVCMVDEDTDRALVAAASTGMGRVFVAEYFSGPTGTGTGVTAATEFVHGRRGTMVLMNVLTALRTSTALGLNVFAEDDNTVGGTGVGTSAAQVPVGELVELEAATTGWVYLDHFAQTNIGV